MTESTNLTIDDKLDEWESGTRIIRGVQSVINSGNVCELAGRIGYDAVWLELEHGTASFETLEQLCVATQVGGAIPVARIPDHKRHHILRTMETGARIVIVPMVNSGEIARQIVQHGKYPPVGQRGFNSSTRGLWYGLDKPLDSFERANRETHLIAQIETLEAMNNLDEILEVKGLSGIFVGPGDLSVALGHAAEFEHPELHEAVAKIIQRARQAGRHAGLLGPVPLLKTGLESGADLVFCGGDITILREGWKQVLERATTNFSE